MDPFGLGDFMANAKNIQQAQVEMNFQLKITEMCLRYDKSPDEVLTLHNEVVERMKDPDAGKKKKKLNIRG